MLEAPHPPHPHLPHHPHPAPPPPAYPLYQSRPDAHRGAHFHHYHPQPGHLAPPPLPPHYQHHTHFHTYGGGAPVGGAAIGSKKKTWNFIHEKMSYDTFFTMKRLIERSQRPDEVLRWVTQNPAKVSHNHYPIALQKIGQLLQTTPPLRTRGDDADTEADFQTLCSAIISDCAKFDNFSIVNCLYAVAALGLPSDSQVVQVLEGESQSRLNQFNQKDVSMVFSSSMKLHPGSQHPLTEACLAGLEKNLERERHPQTLITPYTMALIAKYIARHRLRETRLLDTIADFLVKKAEYLDTKVIQKLVFPFSRMSYRPSSEQQFFSRLEEVVELKALSSPLATVNILMSLFQLGHFPGLVLHRVFSSAFINSPYALIVRRYLSLLDAAVELEYREYTGPRLQDAHKVLMFDHALTADEVNRKYSYKGLVAEALRQLVGEQNYKQDEVLAPGYYTDFLLWMDSSGRVLPIRTGAGLALSIVPSSCVAVTSKPADGPVTVVTWHYCHNSEVLVGSRAMRDRHLRLLGYFILQLPYHELEKLNGIEEVKQYLHKKLLDIPL
uniref:RAP domain-containing protein n=1 Tax=Monopterus albus TaxID=43700 RepID=A0A3Q3PYE2_MONAL